jgi:ATP-dependent DNA helicase RecQ
VDKLELYKFEVANSQYALLIKSMLRTYGGIMDHYTKISEVQLAQQLKTTEGEITKQLKALHKNKMITYVPANDKPTIMLLTERMHESNLYINMKFINQRKKTVKEQVMAMINFIEQRSICRQIVFCKYFGEINAEPCGRCDICLEHKKRQELNADFAIAKELILNKTKNGWMKTEDLLPENAHFARQLYKEVIRFLLDEKKLITNDKNELKSV